MLFYWPDRFLPCFGVNFLNSVPLFRIAPCSLNSSESAITFAISMWNKSQQVNSSRDLPAQLVPSCWLYSGLIPKTSPCYFDSTLTSRCDLCQIVTMVWELVTVATWTSLGLVVHVSRGNLSVLIVTGGFLKMSLIPKMTRTCVVTQTAVPRMDHGVIPLTQMFDGNTATYLDVHLEVNLVIKRTYARAKEHK